MEMNASSTPAAPPRRRKRRAWKVVLTLAVACVAMYYVHQWFFVPEDVRRLQGTWRIVKVVYGDAEPHTAEGWLVFNGNRLREGREGDKQGESRPWIAFDLFPDERQLIAYEQPTFSVLGMTFNVPAWFEPRDRLVGLSYELTGDRLILCVNPGDAKGPREMHLERQP